MGDSTQTGQHLHFLLTVDFGVKKFKYNFDRAVFCYIKETSIEVNCILVLTLVMFTKNRIPCFTHNSCHIDVWVLSHGRHLSSNASNQETKICFVLFFFKWFVLTLKAETKDFTWWINGKMFSRVLIKCKHSYSMHRARGWLDYSQYSRPAVHPLSIFHIQESNNLNINNEEAEPSKH